MDLLSDNTENNNISKLNGGTLNYEEAFPPLGEVAETSKVNGNGVYGNGSSSSHIFKGASSSTNNNSSNGSVNHSPRRLPPVVKAQSYIKVAASLTVNQSECKFKNGIQDVNNQRICQDVSRRFNIVVNPDRNSDGSITYSISGKLENAQNAKVELARLLVIQREDVIQVPKAFHGFICGKNGSRVKELEGEFGVKINMPLYASQSEDIAIWGSSTAIDGVRKKILELVQDQSKRSVEDISIPKKHHPFIYGPYNRTIESLKAQFGVKINIPPIHVDNNVISVMGEAENVRSVIQQFKVINDKMESICTSANITIPKSQHRYIVGVKGSGLSEILEATGVSVEMPSVDDNSETLTLRGPQDKIGQALTMTIAKANSMTEKEIECPVWLQRFLIGRGGSNLNKIRGSNDKVRINFCDPPTSGSKAHMPRKIAIEGPSEQVMEVVQSLQSEIQQLQSTMDYKEVSVEVMYLNHIVGKAGANISQMQKDFDVNIRLPSAMTSKNVDIICIEGHQAGVQRAKEALELFINKLANEKCKDVLIDHQYHKQIIGVGGCGIKDLKERFPNVVVYLPDASEECDVVQIRGPRDEVDSSAKHILGIYKELANLLELRVPISPPNLVALIFGKDSRLLQNIQSESGGAVQIRQDKGKNEALIKGPKDQAEKAKTLLLQLLKEKEALNHEDTVSCPTNLFRILIGKNGANLAEMRQQTGGARVIFPSRSKHLLNDNADENEMLLNQGKHSNSNNDNAEVNNVTIIGTKDSVAKAKKLLEEKILEYKSSIEEVLHIAPKWHRHFLQRKAQILNGIIQSVGGNVSISFPKLNIDYSDSDIVRIKGVPHLVNAAVKQITDIVEDLEAQITLNVSIPRVHHRLLIGRSGERVREFEDCHNVKINFPQMTSDEPSTFGEADTDDVSDVINISGRKENCESARDEILSVIPMEEKVELAVEFHPMLIGQSGSEIKNVQKQFDLFIQVPSQPNTINDRDIVVNGTAKNIALFKKYLTERITTWRGELSDRIARNYEDFILIDEKYHKNIIGFKGNEIKKLREQFDVQIEMPKRNAKINSNTTTTSESNEGGDNASQKVILQGYKENVDRLKNWLSNHIKYLDSLVSEELIVPHEVHSRIIGSKGSNLKRIQDQFSVDIVFPSQKMGQTNTNSQEEEEGEKINSKRDVVLVTGLTEKVDECCEYLIQVANDLMDEHMEKRSIEMLSKNKSNQLFLQASNPKTKTKRNPLKSNKNNNDGSGFHLTGAPWQQENGLNVENKEEFPVIGGDLSNSNTWKSNNN